MRRLLAALGVAFLLSASPTFAGSSCILAVDAVRIIKGRNSTAKVIAVFTGEDAKVVMMIYNTTPPFSSRLTGVDKAIAMYKRNASAVLIFVVQGDCAVAQLMIKVSRFKEFWPKVPVNAVMI